MVNNHRGQSFEKFAIDRSVPSHLPLRSIHHGQQLLPGIIWRPNSWPSLEVLDSAAYPTCMSNITQAVSNSSPTELLAKELELASKRGLGPFKNYCQSLDRSEMNLVLDLQAAELKDVDNINKYCARQTDRTMISAGIVTLASFLFFAICYGLFYQFFMKLSSYN